MTTPTATELAMIAATLAKSADDDNHALARRSLGLWVACFIEAREYQRQQDNRGQQALEQENTRTIANNQALASPVSWDDGFRKLLPGKTETDATPIIKRFCAHYTDGVRMANVELRREYSGDPRMTLPEMQPEALLGLWRKDGWRTGEYFNFIQTRFAEWTAKQISAVRSASAKKRGLQNKSDTKSKKTLAPPKKR